MGAGSERRGVGGGIGGVCVRERVEDELPARAARGVERGGAAVGQSDEQPRRVDAEPAAAGAQIAPSQVKVIVMP